MNDKNKTWAWKLKKSDTAHGLFSTREEAVDDAMGQEGSLDGVEIGHGVWPVPFCYMPDMDRLLDIMEDNADDSEYGFWEDEVFDVADPAAARADLDAAHKAWAEKYITANCWLFVPEPDAMGGE